MSAGPQRMRIGILNGSVHAVLDFSALPIWDVRIGHRTSSCVTFVTFALLSVASSSLMGVGYFSTLG